jgi:plasmid stabilization system protein ParE
MGWPVVLTPQAQDDLREIVSYIARDSPDRARRFGNTLIDQALSIGIFPEMGQVVFEVGDPSVLRSSMDPIGLFMSSATIRTLCSCCAFGMEPEERSIPAFSRMYWS